MPVAFVSSASSGAFVPVPGRAFRIGRSLQCDLVVPEADVALQHATLRYLKGEYLLAAADGCTVEVNGAPVPLIPLRDGDVLRVSPGGRPWTFRNRMEGAFVPPTATLGEAWLGHPGCADPVNGPERLGPGEAIGGRDVARCRRVPSPYGQGQWVVKILGPASSPDTVERHLRLLAALGGAAHPALARVVEGGVAPCGGAPRCWLATPWVQGRTARDVVHAGGLEPASALRALHALASGLAHLHARGVVHRDVAPGNVVLTPSGDAVLIDYGQAFLAALGAPASRGVVGTPGYVAPEEVLEGGGAVTPAADCYGLAAVGYALATGTAPAPGADVLDALARATAAPPRPRALGVLLPEALESAIVEGLDPRPEARPTALAFREALAFAEAKMGLGGAAT